MDLSARSLEGPGHEERLEVLQQKFRQLNQLEVQAVQDERLSWLHRARTKAVSSTPCAAEERPTPVVPLTLEVRETVTATESIATTAATVAPIRPRKALPFCATILLVVAAAGCSAFIVSLLTMPVRV